MELDNGRSPITRLSGSKRFESVLRTPIRHGVPLSRGRSRFLCSRLSFFSFLFFLYAFLRFFQAIRQKLVQSERAESWRAVGERLR